MSMVQDEKRDGLIRALITVFHGQAEMPTRADIEAKAEQLALIMDYKGDLSPVVDETMIHIDSRMGAGVSLIDPESDHDEEWVNKRTIDWKYSRSYEGYLKDEKWPPHLVQSLSDATEKILGLLQNPESEGAWNRRGLVIGHVQSGKTANYMGLIAKAADAGYKFIIVIAGIHNNLRKQTQERIDEGFIGRSSDPENRVRIGVGLEPDYPHPVTLTNVNDDFNQNTANRSGWRINDFSKPIILVIKKYVRTLDALHRWLRDMNAKGQDRIRDVPMLMIDDEADNASINTNKAEIDPTRTNEGIRRILALFAKSCYVGYTATPFANIFIDPDACGPEVREELFPKDFIYALDAPSTYFGPGKVFNETEDGYDPFVRRIVDAENYLPLVHKEDTPLVELPPSLYSALNQFIVARAIRNLRGQANKHCSMLINMSRLVSKHREIKNFVSLRVKKIQDAVQANYRMPENTSATNSYMADLRKAFDEEYANCGETWEDVKGKLRDVCDGLRIFVVNSKSGEALDYRKYERDGNSLTAIAIGGLSLSRGLTIEGLTISYMHRNTRMYDTLMQMGRWFGYRFRYEDLCRIHLPPDSINWYAHIADASEELRQQIQRMQRDGLSPKQFGLYVKSHPDSLLITAANKMRTGQVVTVEQSFSARPLEGHTVSIDPDVNARNFALIEKFWKNGFGGKVAEPTEKGFIFRDAPVSEIDDFLTCFECPASFVDQKSWAVRYLERIAEKYPLADVLLISPPNGPGGEKPFSLRHQRRVVERLNGSSWRLNKDRVASRGDEKLGLSNEQKTEAEKKAAGKEASDVHYRIVRNKPLLMLHSLWPNGKGVAGPIAAFGIRFPHVDYSTTIEVVANKVWIKQSLGFDDNPDEEDDFDDDTL